jgi:two-component system OmpR family response regulator
VRVLIVEDEAKIADVLRRGLQGERIVSDVAGDGEQAVARAATRSYDVILLDVMLPGIDGFETCRRLRDKGVEAPILMLTARDAVDDRVAGLSGGADDYVVKPFAFEEVLARIHALARRGPAERAPILEVGKLRLDPRTHRAWRGYARLDLSAKEFGLLETFMRHPGQVLSRDSLLDQVWQSPADVGSNVIEVHLRNLREKIDRPFGTHTIETVRGVGYRLREPD